MKLEACVLFLKKDLIVTQMMCQINHEQTKKKEKVGIHDGIIKSQRSH